MNEFKRSVNALYQLKKEDIDDSCIQLISLLTSIEAIFENGLNCIISWRGKCPQCCWNVFEKLPSASNDFQIIFPYPILRAIEQVLFWNSLEFYGGIISSVHAVVAL